MSSVDIALGWDAFLEQEVERQQVPELQREGFLRGLRVRIQGFRDSEWLNLKREIAQQTQWKIPDGLEPHWVAAQPTVPVNEPAAWGPGCPGGRRPAC